MYFYIYIIYNSYLSDQIFSFLYLIFYQIDMKMCSLCSVTYKVAGF